MSRTMELPDSLYEALEEAAAARGMTPEDWIAEQLAKETLPKPTTIDGKPARTMADLFADLIGIVDNPDESNLAEEGRERFIEYLEEKRRTGTL